MCYRLASNDLINMVAQPILCLHVFHKFIIETAFHQFFPISNFMHMPSKVVSFIQFYKTNPQIGHMQIIQYYKHLTAKLQQSPMHAQSSLNFYSTNPLSTINTNLANPVSNSDSQKETLLNSHNYNSVVTSTHHNKSMGSSGKPATGAGFAADYAKSKVEQIRKKIGYYSNLPATNNKDKQNNMPLSAPATKPGSSKQKQCERPKQSERSKEKYKQNDVTARWSFQTSHADGTKQPNALTTNTKFFTSANNDKTTYIDSYRCANSNGKNLEYESSKNYNAVTNLNAYTSINLESKSNQKTHAAENSSASNNNQSKSSYYSKKQAENSNQKQHEYQDRIKNIESINKKIMDMLRQPNLNTHNYASVQVSSSKENEKSHMKPASVANNSNGRVDQNFSANKNVQNAKLTSKQNNYEVKTGITNFSNNYTANFVVKNVNNNSHKTQQKPRAVQRMQASSKLGSLPNKYVESIQLYSNQSPMQRLKQGYSQASDYMHQTEKYKTTSNTTQKLDFKVVPVPSQVYTYKISKNGSIEKEYIMSTHQQNKAKQSIKQKQVKAREYEDQYQPVSKVHTTRLAETLGQQITLDQKLRYSKWLFSEWSNQNKWSLLQQKYKRQNGSKSSKSIQELKQIFTLSSDQHNPFFQNSSTLTQSCIAQLLRDYTQANNYWAKSVNQTITISSLQAQYFNVKDLDLGRKGYLSIEDIVCFVNLYTGKFFRNRDATTLFKRFFGISFNSNGNNNLKYEKFLDVITK